MCNTQIAHIENDFPTKFALPRQSLLSRSLLSRIVFEPEYRNPDALRGLEGFSHLWIIWEFSSFKGREWSPTVRPPRLGGNVRMGVFATRSPNRPNPLGLTCVRLEKIVDDPIEGPVLIVSGADMMSGTPIFDIKPYIREADCHIDATDGFVGEKPRQTLDVKMSPERREELLSELSQRQFDTLLEVLSQDPRPSYHDDPERIYGFEYASLELHFRVRENCLEIL